nr:MAG TPA: Large Terminase [Caudoviricetes sp.]
MKQNQQAMRQKEHEKKKRHRERALKLQRLLYLSNLDDREIDPISEEEREALRVELWRGEQSHLRIVEVLYKGEVILTGTRKDVCRKCQPFADTILNNEVLLDGTKIFKGPKGTVASVTYRYIIDNMVYTNKFIVQTKNIENIEGSNPYFIVNDELHKQEKMEQYDNFKSAQISLPQPLMFNISTAGKGSSSVGMRVYREAKEVLKKDDNDSNFVLIYEPNKNYDWTDRKVWEMCNPNWGISVDLSALESAFKTAQRSAHSKAEFLTKHLNVFVNGADNFFEQDQVEPCLVSSKELGDLQNEPCYIGLDLSKTRDLTCVSLNFPTWDENGKSILKVKQLYFIPSEDLDFREKEDNVPYRELEEQGFVEFCDGKMIDQEQILQFIEDCMELYDIQQVNYDPAMSAKLIEKLENLGLECIEVPQYPKYLNGPFDDVERLFYEQRILFDNPLMLYCTLNVVAVTNMSGQKAPSKRQSKKKIDGFVAFLCAHKETMNQMTDFDDGQLADYLGSIYR